MVFASLPSMLPALAEIIVGARDTIGTVFTDAMAGLATHFATHLDRPDA